MLTIDIEFKNYEVPYRKRRYSVLVPTGISGMFVNRCGTSHFPAVNIDADRKGLTALMGCLYLLASHKDLILFFDIQHNWLSSCYGTLFSPGDLVYLHHSLQLKRKNWLPIRRALTYITPEPFRVSVDITKAVPQLEVEVEHWRRTSAYYRNIDRFVEYYQNQTTFYISSRPYFLEQALTLWGFLGDDLESQLFGGNYFPTCFLNSSKFCEVEIGFFDAAIYEAPPGKY